VSDSSSAVTYGVRLPNSGPFADADSIWRMGEVAEKSGYDMLWVHDHISWPREQLTHFATGSIEACTDQDPNFFESLTTMAVLGGRLPRIGLGVVGLVMPLRDPRLLAKQAATINQLTGSRLTLAVAIGNIPADFEALDVPYNRRGRLTNDYLRALRAILDEPQPMSFESESVSFSGTFLPAPGPLPIWVTGSSEPGLLRAATYGDGWMTVYVSTERYQELVTRLEELRAEAGRSRMQHGYETYVCVGRTRDEAISISERSLVDKFGDLEKGLSVCLVGDVSEVADRIEEYRAVGTDHFELKFIGHDVDQLTGMAEQLAARLY